MIRCEWANGSEIEKHYHDTEWGVPLHDDRKLFEFLVLEGAQAGLSWLTVLKKRKEYRKSFDNFDAEAIAQYSPRKIEELLLNTRIIRNRLKITAAVNNARAFLKVQKEFGSFDAYIWSFVNGTPVQNTWNNPSDIPAQTTISQIMSKELKKKGFSFVGPTICYAFMQAVGMVNDHITWCFRYNEIKNLSMKAT